MIKLEKHEDIRSLYKCKVTITGIIEDNTGKKVQKFTLNGTSKQQIYADVIAKKLSKLGIIGEFESEIKL
ncbi:MAG: hypothetical protein N4A62_12340 [Marinisporobacter sp.]|jgi:hypothetical protein|nr:hypothetical protein [Marinisporobacter sp.]